MKRFLILLFALLFSLLLTACGPDGFYSVTVISAGQHELTQNIQGDLLILGGEVTLPENVVVSGSVHLLLGKLTLDGRVEGDVSFLNGELSLGPSAHIRGDLNLGGGSFHPSAESAIEGELNTGAGVPLPSVPERESPADWSFWIRAITNGLFSGLIAAALVRYFPLPIERIGEAISNHSLASGSMGILVGIVGISLLVTIAYTIILIPVSILMLFLLAAGVFLGWVGLGNELGRFLIRLLKRPARPSGAAFLGMFVFMPGLQLLTTLPAIGGLLGIALAAGGLGAVSLTRFGLRRFVPATDENLYT
jgi:hypothetical protein